jgi:two-component system, sensor histidine kinase YesM
MENKFIDSIIGHLTTISTMATLEDAANTRKLTKALINYMKYKIRRENQIVKLEEEIKYIKDLVYIYQVRNENLLECSFSIDEGCGDNYIPHFSIMSLVENSLIHAFGKVESKWLINIKAESEEDYLLIVISDNAAVANVTIKIPKV